MISDLSDLIEYAFSDETNKLKTIKLYDLEKDEIRFLEKLLLITLSDFKHTVDNYAIIRTHNKHGQESKEISRGQIAVLRSDYLLVPKIITEPDKVSIGEKSGIGTDLIIHEKEINGVVYFYVEEVRKKRKSLAMKTLYKRKASTKVGV
ncbi:MAG: hypothetical protein U5N85_02030 [Arcicella sp.]|nr:hypothetical protein [Arcicella sp.]